MIVSCHGVRGKRSLDQSKYGFVTTDFGINGAESASFFPSGLSKKCPNTASFHCTCPSTAFPYGSSSSFDGMQRLLAFGSHGPCTRYPYSCPGPVLGTYPCQMKPVSCGRSTQFC